MGRFLKEFVSKNEETKNKKKIENIIFLVLILIVTLVVINVIWKGDNNSSENTKTENHDGSILANNYNEQETNETEQHKTWPYITTAIR